MWAPLFNMNFVSKQNVSADAKYYSQGSELGSINYSYHLLIMLFLWFDPLGLQGGMFLITLGHSMILSSIPCGYFSNNSSIRASQYISTSSSILKMYLVESELKNFKDKISKCTIL